MPSLNFNLESRINALTSVLSEAAQQRKVEAALKKANGDWTVVVKSLKKDKSLAASLKKLDLAHSLAEWSDDNTPVVKALAAQQKVKNLRDVALNYSVIKLAEIVDPEILPETITGETATEKKQNYAVALQNRLFNIETSAVLQRMVKENEIAIADTTVRSDILNFLNNQPEFNIRTTSIYTAIKNTDAFKGIAEDRQAGVIHQLKTLQRVQALTTVPEAVPVLIKANLTSAFQIGEMP